MLNGDRPLKMQKKDAKIIEKKLNVDEKKEIKKDG